MGYSTVPNRTGAVIAAAALVGSEGLDAPEAVAGGLLIDQLMAEAGIVEPTAATAALQQARGDLARAVSLIRAWAAVLPRLAHERVKQAELRPVRRITPGFAEPSGGQYLGASLDYAPRLLELDEQPVSAPVAPVDPNGTAPMPARFPRSIEPLRDAGLVAPPDPVAFPVDVTRQAGTRTSRGALLQILSRAETGAMTALAYTLIRGYSQLQDPTLVELRSGRLPVRLKRPGGATFTVGEITATTAEVALYRVHGGSADPRLTLGFGATVGRVERRAISAALLDGACARAADDAPGRREPAEDAEFLTIALDGQEATGFVEHLKLPHHVTFTSELDRVRQARRTAALEDDA